MSDAAPKKIDVLGLGCAAVDELVYVASFPLADRKEPVLRRARSCGGLTGTALVTASRLGAVCAFAGRLGPDEACRHVEENFRRENVDVAHAPREPDANVVHSTIVVGEDTGSRNVFFQTPANVGAHPTLPSEDVIRSARVLFIDHLGMEGNLRAACVARASGIPVVADFEVGTAPEFGAVLEQVDHLVLSEAFACEITGCPSAEAAAVALWSERRAVVVVTCGSAGLWWVDRRSGGRASRLPAFVVTAVDTTGCGDVFHGAYAASLARGCGLEDRLLFASAAAALKAMHADIPRRLELDRFLGERNR